jgi:hypothetical protein
LLGSDCCFLEIRKIVLSPQFLKPVLKSLVGSE